MLNFIKRYWPTALATLLLLTAVTGVYAKYVVDQTIGGVASITAKLGTITLLEHKPSKDDSGKYTLGTETVTEYTYDTVIPGLDIPKDPYVQITDKTPIEAYVFVEVKDNLPANSKITYEIDTENWTNLDVTGANGGTVYVYKEKIDDQFGTNGTGTISILKPDTNGNSVFVSQYLKQMAIPDDGVQIKFFSCMGQTDAGANEAAVYTALFSPST